MAAIAVCVAGVPTATAAPSKPSAADLRRAEELYDNGRTLFAEGSYAAAAIAFEQAWELSGQSDMLFNAALAYDRADDLEHAIAALDRYRAVAAASERAALDERKRGLQRRLEQKQAAAAADAEPTPTLTGAEPWRSPEPDAPPAPAPRVAPRKPVTPVAWALLGTGLAGFAVATGLGGGSLAASRRAAADCTTDAGALRCRDAASSDVRLAHRLALGSDIAFALAAGITIAFVAVLAVDRTRARRARPHAWLRPVPGGLAGRF